MAKKERQAKLESEARNKELALLSEESVHKDKVASSNAVERLVQGSSQRDRERRHKLQEQAEEQLKAATEVRADMQPAI